MGGRLVHIFRPCYLYDGISPMEYLRDSPKACHRIFIGSHCARILSQTHTHAPQYTHTHIVRQKVNRKFVIVFFFAICALQFQFQFRFHLLLHTQLRFSILSLSLHFLSLFHILFDILISGGLLQTTLTWGEGGGRQLSWAWKIKLNTYRRVCSVW